MGAGVIANLGGSSRQAGAARPLDVTILDASGNPITSFGGAGGTASDFGAAFPTPGTAIGFKDSTGALMAPGNLDASGNLKIAGSFSSTPITAATRTLSNIAENLASVTLLAANANRLSFRIFNDSNGILFIKCGVTASATSYTEKILPMQSWGTQEIGVNDIGRIDGIWATTPGTAGAAARMTEWTA